MDEASTDDFDAPRKQTIDHEKRKGGSYESRPMSEEQRRIRSEAMKAFNLKTRKNTALCNMLARRTRKPK